MSTEEPSFTPCPWARHHWTPQHSECYERHVCTRSDGSKDAHMSGGLGRNLPRQKLSGGRGREEYSGKGNGVFKWQCVKLHYLSVQETCPPMNLECWMKVGGAMGAGEVAQADRGLILKGVWILSWKLQAGNGFCWRIKQHGEQHEQQNRRKANWIKKRFSLNLLCISILPCPGFLILFFPDSLFLKWGVFLISMVCKL